MSKATSPRIPTYRLHKSTGQAVVTLNGRDVYLGRYGTQASQLEYDRLISEWIAAGRQLPSGSLSDLTVSDMLLRYWRFAELHYRKDGKSTHELDNIRYALRPLRRLYGHALVREFGPRSLKALQSHLIEADLSRRVINQRIGIVKRVFRWAVSEELAPAHLSHALSTVSGLQRGRTAARETDRIRPVSDTAIDATIAHLPKVVADMVQFQRRTGCRPGEACLVRPADIDRSGEIWSYVPRTHKTEHHGLRRVIFIGPKAQAILRPYLLRDANAYCFSPIDSERARKAELRAARRTRVQPSQQNRTKVAPKKTPGQRYTRGAYLTAIRRACDAAFPPPDSLDDAARKEWRKRHRWFPNQLRHKVATEVRQKFGLEAAQVTLGHASADVSEIYAERDFSKAAAVMREVG
jgi:integrase